MKGNKIMRLLKLFCPMLGLLLLTGCFRASNDSSQQAVAMLVGAHGNSRALNLNSILVTDTVGEAISSHGFLSVIIVDGQPDLIQADSYAVKETQKGNPELLQKMAEKKAQNFLESIKEVRANDEEVDLLESFRLAIRSLSSVSDGAQKTILVIDSGLSTTGYLDFTNNLISADPKAVADILSEKKAIPDFEGITVKWAQMGDVYTPQSSLSPNQKQNLKDIWTAVIEKTGGKLEISEEVAGLGGVSGEVPNVTPIDLPIDSPISFSSEENNNYMEGVTLTEEKIRFLPDSDRYVSERQAHETLKVIATDLQKDITLNILLVGTTAGDQQTDFALDLSFRRARTVMNSLISLGIDGYRMKPMGLGSADPWHIHGVGTEGSLASQNRKVVILAMNSPIAKTILR